MVTRDGNECIYNEIYDTLSYCTPKMVHHRMSMYRYIVVLYEKVISIQIEHYFAAKFNICMISLNCRLNDFSL